MGQNCRTRRLQNLVRHSATHAVNIVFYPDYYNGKRVFLGFGTLVAFLRSHEKQMSLKKILRPTEEIFKYPRQNLVGPHSVKERGSCNAHSHSVWLLC
jgi:hypothetical protein